MRLIRWLLCILGYHRYTPMSAYRDDISQCVWCHRINPEEWGMYYKYRCVRCGDEFLSSLWQPPSPCKCRRCAPRKAGDSRGGPVSEPNRRERERGGTG